MKTSLPLDVSVVELPDGIRYRIPRSGRLKGAMEIYSLFSALLIFGFFFVCGAFGLSYILEDLLKTPSPWLFVGLSFMLLWLLIPAIMIRRTLFDMFGTRCSITIRNGRLRVVEQLGPIWRTKSRRLDRVKSIEVGPLDHVEGPFARMNHRECPPNADRCLYAGCTDKPLLLAKGVNRNWMIQLADHISERLPSAAARKNAATENASMATVVHRLEDGGNAHIPQPPNSRIIVTKSREELTVCVPPLAFRNAKGLIFFAAGFLTIVGIHTLVATGAGVIGGAFHLLFLSLFWIVGLVALTAAICQWRTWTYLSMNDGIFQLTRRGSFGETSRAWALRHVREFELGPSSMPHLRNHPPDPGLRICFKEEGDYTFLGGRDLQELRWLSDLLQRHLELQSCGRVESDPFVKMQPAADQVTVQREAGKLRLSLRALRITGRLAGWTMAGGMMITLTLLSWLAPTVGGRPAALDHWGFTLVFSAIGLLGLAIVVEVILLCFRTLVLTLDHETLEVTGTGLLRTSRRKWCREQVRYVDVGPNRNRGPESFSVPSLQIHCDNGKTVRCLEHRPEELLLRIAAVIDKAWYPTTFLPSNSSQHDAVPETGQKHKQHVGESNEAIAEKQLQFMKSPVDRILRILINGIPIIAVVVILLHMMETATLRNHWSSDHHARFSFDQPWMTSQNNLPGIRFELPEGWKIKYNGHQRWRGGTVADSENNPQIEVWLFAYRGRNRNAQTWSQLVEHVTLPLGDVEVRKREHTHWPPFHSLSSNSSEKVALVRYSFFVGEHDLSFSILKSGEAELKPIIWEIMQTAEYYRP